MRRAAAPGGPLHCATTGGGVEGVGGVGGVGGVAAPPPGALGCLHDVAAVVRGSRPLVLCALADTERLLGTAVAALSGATEPGAPGRRAQSKATRGAMTRTARKVHFLTVWANEQSEEAYLELRCGSSTPITAPDGSEEVFRRWFRSLDLRMMCAPSSGLTLGEGGGGLYRIGK
jgi:hypothetical protein